MIDKLVKLIMQHLDTLTVIRKLTSYCVDHFEDLDENVLEFELENRERLINHLSEITGLIESIVTNSKLSRTDHEILNVWNENCQLLFLETNSLDSLLVNRLDQSVILTKQSIRETVKARKLAHTYGPNSTR